MPRWMNIIDTMLVATPAPNNRRLRVFHKRRLTSSDSAGLRCSLPLLHVLHFPPASVLHLSVPVPVCHGGSLRRGGMPGYSWRQNDLWQPVVCMAQDG